MIENFWSDILYFRPEEVVCTCGCGTGNISFEIMWLADRLREIYQEILREKHNDHDAHLEVSSGCRCPTHNVKIKGSPFSLHLTIPGHLDGCALDLKPPLYQPYSMEILAAAANKLNPPGLKVYQTWVHIDFRRGRWRD